MNTQLHKGGDMATRTLVLTFFVLVSFMFVRPDSGFAQDTEGRWVLGFHGGGNMWFNDYNERVIGPGGDITLRYGISPAFSAGLLAGYEELKSKQDPPFAGQAGDYLKLHAMPAAATLWVHFASGKSFNPYVYAGFGAMLYKRLDGAAAYIPDSKFITSINVPFGVGFEVFPSKSSSFVIDVGYRITDDYPDGIKKGNLGGYLTAKAGMNFYFGTSTAEKEELARAEAQRIKDLAAAEARRVKELAEAEARRVKALAEAEAQRIKDSTEAAARRLADQRGRDTVIILEKGKTVVLKGVNFEFNKATLTSYSENILERALSALRTSPDLNVLIVGHTDNVGSAAYNKNLSMRRAQAVKTWLVKKGITAKRLSVSGKGFDEPIDTNNTEDGRLNNRRIEFRVLE